MPHPTTLNQQINTYLAIPTRPVTCDVLRRSKIGAGDDKFNRFKVFCE
jgi:hypothetical protein